MNKDSFDRTEAIIEYLRRCLKEKINKAQKGTITVNFIGTSITVELREVYESVRIKF